MQLTLRHAVTSETGRRPNNEDMAFAGTRLLVLADGMGGGPAGEIAASLAVEQMKPFDDGRPDQNLMGELRRAVSAANAAIAGRIAADPDTVGMGTTLTAVLFEGSFAAVAHIGDSRAYLFRDGTLTQITKDDTYVQALIDDGRIIPEQAWNHPLGAILLKVLRGAEDRPHLELRGIHPGDRYLLCSDGLSDYVLPDTIVDVLRIPDLRTCADELIRKALQHGSQDNITCIVADIVEGAGD
jgi:PPM family protein phosphatase